MILARWHPAIGDPTVFGWITVGGYALAAIIAGIALRRAREFEQELETSAGNAWQDCRAIKRFWALVLVTMVVLGINKQLDLQTLFVEKVRNRAYSEGWYADRRRYQMDFIGLMTVAAAISGCAIAIWLRRVLVRVAWAITGLAMLMLFVLVRASSFHYVDKVLALGDAININELLELGGIGFLVAAMVHWIGTERRQVATKTVPGVPLPCDQAEVAARRV